MYEFSLPESYPDASVDIRGEKAAFMARYVELEKQKFLSMLLQEFKALPELLAVSFDTVDDAKSLEPDLTFAPGYDPQSDANYFEAQATGFALQAAYIEELHLFCAGLRVKRSMLLTETNTERFTDLKQALAFVETD
jgi:hypothetical protein